MHEHERANLSARVGQLQDGPSISKESKACRRNELNLPSPDEEVDLSESERKKCLRWRTQRTLRTYSFFTDNGPMCSCS